jgi:two-component system, sensor histidine kinase RegB
LRHAVFGILLLDAVTLTGLLLAAGAAMNPFSVFYLVHVALAALLLDPRRTWVVAGFTSLAFGALFVLPSHALDAHSRLMQHGATPLHLQGMWFAYSLAAGFVAHFVSRVASALQAREREIFEMQRAHVHTDRLAALSTLAAGAAHELGTPLGTIALVAKELEHGLEREPSGQGFISDARLIRQEVERCRDILRQMAARAGEGAGEMPRQIAIHDVEASLLTALGSLGSKIVFENESSDAELVLPQGLLVQVLANLVNNALDAQLEAGRSEPVRVVSRIESSHASFEIIDRGSGIPELARARLGEPFFTTKAPGKGLGLGVFLARAFAEKMGGGLAFEARAIGGTLARLTLPRNVLTPRAQA